MKTMTELVMELFPLWSPVECDLALPKSDNEDDFVREFSIDGVEVYRLQVYYLLYVQESSGILTLTTDTISIETISAL